MQSEMCQHAVLRSTDTVRHVAAADATIGLVASEARGAVLGSLREHGRLAQRAEGVQALLVQPGRDAARVVRVPAEWQRLDLATPPTTSQPALLLVHMHASRPQNGARYKPSLSWQPTHPSNS